MYGPLVLAARLGSDDLSRGMQYDTIGKNIHPPGDPKAVRAPELLVSDVAPAISSRAPLAFTATGANRRYNLIPLYTISGERYAVYFRTQQI
jgi:uncharacterized protein